MRAPDDTTRLLELLREAGDEAVTLDELAVVGVSDPASALLDLELSGHAISRVLDDRRECVRLAPFDGVHLLAQPEPAGEESSPAGEESSPADEVRVAGFGEDRPASPDEQAFVAAVFGGDRPASPDGTRPARAAAAPRLLVAAALLLLALLFASRR